MSTVMILWDDDYTCCTVLSLLHACILSRGLSLKVYTLFHVLYIDYNAYYVNRAVDAVLKIFALGLPVYFQAPVRDLPRLQEFSAHLGAGLQWCGHLHRPLTKRYGKMVVIQRGASRA